MCHLNVMSICFSAQESVSGLLQIHCSMETKHDGIFASIEGAINLMLGKKSVGILDSFSSATKPIQLLGNTVQLVGPAKLPQGFTELAFEFPIIASAKEQKTLFETYHGIFININYMIKCEIRRNFLSKSVQKAQQFVIQYKPKAKVDENVVSFTISSENLRKLARERVAIPRFLITGRLDTTDCCITKPLTGHVISYFDAYATHSSLRQYSANAIVYFQVVIQHTEVAIKSIDLQLVRVETCGCAEGFSRDGNYAYNH